MDLEPAEGFDVAAEDDLEAIQGYLAHKKQLPPTTLQQDYPQGHMVALGRGGLFLASKVPL